MILNHKVYGSSENKIIILHGLLGSLDNWVTVAKNLSNRGYEIILIDQRNHGKSFHTDQFDYEIMSMDLKKFLDKKKIQKVSLICLLYTSPSPRDRTRSRMPSSA